MEVFNVIKSWDDFWAAFKMVCESLHARKQSNIANQLEDAKSCWVDDGYAEWFEFYYSIDYLIDKYFEFFVENDKVNLIRLRTYLDNYLHN